MIKKFDFKTPGREDDDEETKLYTKADYQPRGAGATADSQQSVEDAKSR